jgi:hypothetical protein
MHSPGNLDSTIFELREQLKVAHGQALDIIIPSQNAGVAQLVEHHLAKVDVASSSLVTR